MMPAQTLTPTSMTNDSETVTFVSQHILNHFKEEIET